MDRQEIIDRILPYFQKNKSIRTASLFGSYAENTHSDASDVDVLVQVEDNVGLFRFKAIRPDLEDILGKRVDLVSEGGLKPALKDIILHHKVTFYEKG